MTKHYIAPKEKVLLTDQKYNGTSWSNYDSTDAGKIAKVTETTTGSGIYELKLVNGTPSSPAWSDVTSKPFSTIGSGLTVTGDVLTADAQLHFEILDITTHPASESYKNTIALVARGTPAETGNVYTEYACVKTSSSPDVWSWEKLGDVTASVDQTTSTITINGVVINTASSSQIGLLSSTDWSTFNGKQNAIAGKGLSTNDYTDADKSKLTGIESGAEVNVQSDWNISDSQDDGYIKNKPSALTPTPHASTHADGGTDEIVIAESQVTGLVDDLAGKQDLIDSGNKLSADKVDDTATANRFVTGADKIAWNAKQNALTFDNVPTQGSSNPAKSGGIYDAIATVQANADSKVADVKLNGASVVNSSKEAVLVTIDNLTSAGNQNPLSANQGKLLNDRINNLETIGRFLSLWNCATGQPTTQPTSLPYTYKTGDYFIITTVGATNYKPDGLTYTGEASTTVTTDDVQTGDIWRFDGTNWTLEINHSSASGVVDVTIGGTSIVSAGVAVIPTASSSGAGVITAQDWSTFNGKQNALTFDNLPTANSDNPVKSSGIRTAIDRKVRSGTTAPSVVGDESVGDIYVQYSA